PGLSSVDVSDDERFRALARAAREAVFIHEQGTIREINDAFTRLLGYERDEILGRDGLTTFIGPESRAEVLRSMRQEGGGEPRGRGVVAKDGTRRIVLSAAEPIRYLGRPMRVVTMQDWTERVALASENQRIAELLRAIIDHTSQSIWVKDLDGRLLMANK